MSRFSRFKKQAVSYDDQIRVYIVDLEAYNAGKLRGEWVDLPSYGELEEVIDRMTDGGEHDFAIHDYEAPFKIDDFTDVFAFDEMLERVEDEGLDLRVVACIRNYGGYSDWDDAISAAEDAMVYEAKDQTDLAYTIVEDVYGGVSGLPNETKEMYFDYCKFGRDASTELYDRAAERFYEQFANDCEYGEALVDEIGFPDNDYYFDYAKYGRDLAMDFYECDGLWISHT